MAGEKNQYWIPNLDINKKVITQEIQYYLGPEATVRAYTLDVLNPSPVYWQLHTDLNLSKKMASSSRRRESA